MADTKRPSVPVDENLNISSTALPLDTAEGAATRPDTSFADSLPTRARKGSQASSQTSKRSYRTSGNRRLTGRLSIERLTPAIGMLSSESAHLSRSPQAIDADEDDPSGSDDGTSSDSLRDVQSTHARLLKQVADWLQDEQARSQQLDQNVHSEPQDETSSERSNRKSRRRREGQSAAVVSTQLALKRLDGILRDNAATLAQSRRSTTKHRSYFHHRPGSNGLKRLISGAPLSSDTEYPEADALVPSVDAVLDNSKTLAYTGGAADNVGSTAGNEQAVQDTQPWLNFKNEIIRLAHTLRLRGWRRVPLDAGSDVDVRRLSGALTNAVYVVAPPQKLPESKAVDSHGLPQPRRPPVKLLLRIYGPKVNHLIDRELELQILRRLARKNIGPRLLGTFANGRFEEYYDARTLTPRDLRDPDMSQQIAKRMRELHDGIELLREERKAGPFVWQNWDKWMTRCSEIVPWLDEQILPPEDAKTAHARTWRSRGYVCGVEWRRFRKAVDRYRKWLQEQYGGREAVQRRLVFAHNDTQYGNLLRLEPSGTSPLLLPANEHKRLVVIDFEYANANMPGLEFANHFTEWCYNYHAPVAPHSCNTAVYPTLEEQRRFLRAYVLHRPDFGGANPTVAVPPTSSTAPAAAARSRSSSSATLQLTSSVSSFTLDSRAPPAQLREEERVREEQITREVDRLLLDTRRWRVANSAHWVAWGVVQAKVPGMEEELARKRAAAARRRHPARTAVKGLMHAARDRAGGGAHGSKHAHSNRSVTDKKAKTDKSIVMENEIAENEASVASEDEMAAVETQSDRQLDAELDQVYHDSDTRDDAEFDYLAFARERAMFFWGDLLEMGLVKADELPADVLQGAKRVPY